MKFEMWGWLHYLFIASPFIFLLITYFCFEKTSHETKRVGGIVFSVIAVLWLVARNIEICYRDNWQISDEIIPLQICHFANFVLLFAFIYNNKTLFSLAFCLNLPAALMSIIFADSLANYTTILSARGLAYIYGHMLIVGITLYAYVFDFIHISLKNFIKTIIIMLIMYVLSIGINNLFNYLVPNAKANYFYSLRPEEGTPLELFYNWSREYKFGQFIISPLYLLLTAILGGIVVSAFYGMYIFHQKMVNKKS